MRSVVLGGVLTFASALMAAGMVWAVVRTDEQQKDTTATAQAADAWARYDAQLTACERGNVLRRHVNGLVEETDALAYLLGRFFDSSAEFRLREGKPGLAEQSVDARDTVLRIAAELEQLPLVECQSVIARPTVARPAKEEP